jgi:hypothetical protein
VINSRGDTAAHTTLSGDCSDDLGDGSPCPAEQIELGDSSGVSVVDSAPTAGGQPPVLTDLSLTATTLSWRHAGAPESVQLP